MEAVAFLIVTLVAVLVFVGLMIYEGYKEAKTNKEIKLRQSDRLLQTYYTEMNTGRNDGWSKLHYTEKYNERLKNLKNK